MLKLLYAPTSPYARKVRIVLAEKKIECEAVIDLPYEASSQAQRYNPLGKIPVLVLDDGTSLYDSRVIVEYLDNVSPVSRLIPEPARQRIVVRRWEALADGICDATAAVVQERKRPPRHQDERFVARQAGKVSAALAEMSRELAERAWCNGDGYTLGDIAAGCALGYLDLRDPGRDWRGEYPNLARHAERLGKRSSFIDTAPAVMF